MGWTLLDSTGVVGRGMAEREVVLHVLRDDNCDFEVRPEMIADEWEENCEKQATWQDGEPKWDVWFKYQYRWRKGDALALGHTLEEATEYFLNDVWKKGLWGYWTVFDDEDYAAMGKENEEGAGQ